MPTTSEFQCALTSLHPLADHHNRILEHHYRAPSHTATATELANAMGYAEYNAINLHYGKFADLVCDKLGVPHDFTTLLAGEAQPNDENGHLELEMNPNLVKAIENLGWY